MPKDRTRNLLGAMEKTQGIDEMTLERLWGEEITQISPEVRAIIASALKKAQLIRERKPDFSQQ